MNHSNSASAIFGDDIGVVARRAAACAWAVFAIASAHGDTTNTVTTAAELESAFASANNSVILLKPGAYAISSTLCRTNVTVSLVGVAADGVTPAARGDVVITAADGDNDGEGDFRIMLVEGVSGTSSVTLRHITFRGGHADAQGGAVCVNKNSTLLIEDCVFDGNRAKTDGGAVAAWGPLTLADCVFSGNVSDSGAGGAIFVRSEGTVSGTVEIDRCVFAENLCGGSIGGAVSFGETSVNTRRALAMRNCLFSGNRMTSTSSSTLGGALYVKSIASITGVVENCTFVGNSTSSIYNNGDSYSLGGAIYEATPLAISNCVFYANRSFMDDSKYSGGKRVSPWKYANIGAGQPESFALVGNCLFCNDPDYPALDFASDFSGTPDGITPVSDGVNGNKVGAYSPGFVNAAAGDYTLAAGSVCIDAGVSASWMTAATDLRNSPKIPRVIGAAPDIGCYEWYDQNKATVLSFR